MNKKILFSAPDHEGWQITFAGDVPTKVVDNNLLADLDGNWKTILARRENGYWIATDDPDQFQYPDCTITFYQSRF